MWECRDDNHWALQPPLETQAKSCPHAILFDLEAFQDRSQRKRATGTLTLKNTHVPISVSVGDTLERKPTLVCDVDPKELIRKFMEELERRAERMSAKVRVAFLPMVEWCVQLPALGFNF